MISLLTVRISSGSGKKLARFRGLVSYDEFATPDPRKAAVELLRRMHDENASDYWVNLSLSQALAEQNAAKA